MKNVFLFLSSVIVILSSSLFVVKYSNMCPVTMGGADSAVFSNMGMAWASGLVPYRDLFDHKGPVLYLINAFGYFINGEFYGVVYIQVFFMILFGLLFLFFNKDNSITYTIFYIFMMYFCLYRNYQGGNLTEEYSIIFNTISAYVYLKKNKFRFLVYGAMGALVFLIRPNLAAPSFSFVILDFCETKSVNLLKNTIYLIVGFLIFILPCCIYFYINNAFDDFIRSYFIFNINYTRMGQNNLHNAYIKFLKYNKIIFIFLTIYILPLIALNIKLMLKCIFILMFSFIFMCISGKLHNHYFLVMIVPIFTVYVIISNYYKLDSLLPSSIEVKINDYIAHINKKIISIFFILIMCCFAAYLIDITKKTTRVRFNTTKLNELRAFFAGYGIDKNSKILNLGYHSHSSIFYILHTLPHEKDFFPATARITNKFDSLLKSKYLTCPDSSYDVVVMRTDMSLAERCPYQILPSPLPRSKIYRRNWVILLNHRVIRHEVP